MAKRRVTVCHGLKIIPTSDLIRFARVGAGTIMAFHGGRTELPEVVPGTVMMTTETEEGTVSRVIDFEITEVSHEVMETLETLKAVGLVATYRDESGNERVCGSPDFPLSLDFYDSEGVVKVSLSGKSNEADGFIIED